MTSIHYLNDRKNRENIIKMIGFGHIISYIEIDKGHKNGPEIHLLSDTGIITIFNKRTQKLITRLIARPGQVKRFPNFTETVYRLAYEHMQAGYNTI